MRIAIITDPTSDYANRAYYLKRLVPHFEALGHSLVIGHDETADAAWLHVDLSVVPAEYWEACGAYPRVINGAALDIRKRTVSLNLVTLADEYAGPVIVKTDLNFGGRPEAAAAKVKRFQPPPYRVYESKAKVPASVWADASLVVERFLEEHDERGYAIRTWMFLGDKERCARYLGDEPVLKVRGMRDREPCDVPDSLRAERKRLGFDYGKFDFVIHDGVAHLLDASRTPGSPSGDLSYVLAESDADLAQGIESLLG